MITLKLARGDNYESVPLRLPATPAEVGEAFAMLDEISRYAGETKIAGVVGDVSNIGQYIKTADLNAPNTISKLNRLAEKIDSMGEQERHTFSGALDAESINGLDDVLRIADSLGDYEMIEDVSSDRELGGWLVEHGYLQVPEYVRPYLDYVAIGAEYYSNHDGAYTLHGYVKRREAAQEQAKDDKPIFRLHLTHGQRECRLNLPADESQLDAAKKSLAVEDFAQANIYRVSCSVAYLSNLLPTDCISVEDANELALAIREMQQADGELLKYLAVLSVEKPEDFPAALNYALNLDDYERITEGTYEYGQSVLRRNGANQELLDIIDGYMDFEKLGEDSMVEDGVRQTEFGLLRRCSSPFSAQENRQTIDPIPNNGLSMKGIV